MNISIVANVINVVGNCVGVFALKMGAAGVAWPSFFSRVLSAVAVTAYCFKKQCAVRYCIADVFAWGGSLLKKSHGNRTAERCGKRCSPARKSGAFKYGCTVRNLSDRSRQTLFICFLPYGLFQPETLLAEFADAELDAPLDILRCRFKVQ